MLRFHSVLELLRNVDRKGNDLQVICAQNLKHRMKEEVLGKTKQWVENFVIGLKICPFAAVPAKENRIVYRYSAATDIDVLFNDLMLSLSAVIEAEPEEVETAILVHPEVLNDFEMYLDFLGIAEEALEKSGLEGHLQIASFHPDYQFDGVDADDLSHHTNRSPYPMLHILRELSVTNAVDTHPDIEGIPERNIELMRSLGLEKLKEIRGF